jgi:cytochrome c oxidase subunit 2
MMKPKHVYTFSFLMPGLFLLAITIGSPRKVRAETEGRVIEITAKRFEFSPSQITLKKGETVKLRLISQDVHHGFFLRPLKLDEEIAPGETHDVTVTPQTAGTFTIICDHFCGANHGNMKMTVVVE